MLCKCVPKATILLSIVQVTFQKTDIHADAFSMSRKSKPKLAHLRCSSAQRSHQYKHLRYTQRSYFRRYISLTERYLLVQVSDLAKLIQTPNVQVGCEKRTEHRLSTREEVCLDFPSSAIEVENVHVTVILIVFFAFFIMP